MIVQASSSVIAAGINETIPVPALPFLITQNSSPSFRFLWNLQFVKFRGLGFRIAPAGPSPFPSLPWQLKQVPLPSNNAFPLATLSGVFATGFFMALASAIWSGGTRGLSGSFSSAPTTVAESNITAAATPKHLDRYPIRLLLVIENTVRQLGPAAAGSRVHVKGDKASATITMLFCHCQANWSAYCTKRKGACIVTVTTSASIKRHAKPSTVSIS